jgi:hypothetical protein
MIVWVKLDRLYSLDYETLTDIPWEPDALNRSASERENGKYKHSCNLTEEK